MMRGMKAGAISAALALGGLMISAAAAEAATTLGFSYAATGVGYCAAGNCSGSHLIYTN